MRQFAALAALAALVSPAASAADPQPGLYEVSMQMLVRGAPMPMPAMSFRQCLTAGDIADGRAWRPSEKPDACKISNLGNANSRVSFNFTCSDNGVVMHGTASGSSDTSGYSMLLTGKIEPAINGLNEFRQTMKGKRIGDCAQ